MGLVHHLETDAQVKGQVIERRPDVDPRHRMGVHWKETSMVTTLCYKVIDLSLHDEDSLASMEDVLNQQTEEGWELVTSFQRTHKALQVGSTTVHVPGLVSTVLVFKRAD
jgi:hypothetical protein